MPEWLLIINFVSYTLAVAGLGFHYGRKRGLRDAIRIVRSRHGK